MKTKIDMKTEDLRIGNYVKCVDGNIIRINKEDMMCILTQTYEVKPIPLKEEILLKCGFKCYAESGVSKGFSTGLNPVTNDYMLTLTWLKCFKSNQLEDYPFYKNGYHVVKYLHQLQNLYFALCGEEMEVNL